MFVCGASRKYFVNKFTHSSHSEVGEKRLLSCGIAHASVPSTMAEPDIFLISLRGFSRTNLTLMLGEKGITIT